MTDSFELSTEAQRENVREFIEIHGSEGFFILYFRQLFYRYVKQELKSAAEDVDGVGEQLYFAEDGESVLREYRDELLEQCEERARELVAEIQARSDLDHVIQDGDIEQLDKFEEEFKQAVHARFEEWEEEGIELVEKMEAGREDSR